MESGSAFKSRYPEWREIDPAAWVEFWAGRYDGGDNDQYFALIEKHGRLSGEDLELAGRWKEDCLKPGNGRWKAGTPRAYEVWVAAKADPPECPPKDGIAQFLKNWSDRTFAAGMRNGRVLQHRFGLSRSTCLLHVISGGQYPIFDSRVATAMARLGSPVEESIVGYLNSFCARFSQLASLCGVSGTVGLRKLDNALFSYGAETSFPDSEE
jgi:hypothetical protein